MPLGHYDIQLVVDVTGNAISDVQIAHIIHNFAIKCDGAARYQYEIVDGDGYGVYGSPRERRGPTADEVNRRCLKFRFRLYAATPGTYNIRVMGD